MKDLSPFIRAYAPLAGHDLPEHDPMKIAPPVWAAIIEVMHAAS